MGDENVVIQCLDSLKILNILKTKLGRQIPEDNKFRGQIPKDNQMIVKKLSMI